MTNLPYMIDEFLRQKILSSAACTSATCRVFQVNNSIIEMQSGKMDIIWCPSRWAMNLFLWTCFCEPVFVKPLVNTTSLRCDWINLAWLWVAGKLFALKIIPGACYLAFTKYSSRLLMDANTNCIFLESHFCRISQSTLFFLLVKE